MIKLNRKECHLLTAILDDDNIGEVLKRKGADGVARSPQDFHEIRKAFEAIRNKINEGSDDKRAGRWNPNIDINLLQVSERLNKKYYPKASPDC